MTMTSPIETAILHAGKCQFIVRYRDNAKTIDARYVAMIEEFTRSDGSTEAKTYLLSKAIDSRLKQAQKYGLHRCEKGVGCDATPLPNETAKTAKTSEAPVYDPEDDVDTTDYTGQVPHGRPTNAFATHRG